MRRYVIALIASLSACTGDTGPIGPPGPAGTNGTDGMTGMTGSQGSQGVPGSQVFDQLQIPGANFYPESITADTAGNIYTGSVTTGEIVKFAPFDDTPMVLHAAGADGIVGVAGLLADSTNSKLWICSVDFTFANPTQVAELDLATGAKIATFDMPNGAGAFCNDLALDATGNLYVTDSFGTVAKLPAGGTALATWAQDDRWTPVAQNEFTVDGIAIDGTTVYVNLLSDPAVYPTSQAALFTIDVTNTGDAGTITQLNVSAGAADVPLSGADGMRLDNHDLIIVEPSGNLWDFAITSGNADGTLLSNRLYQPSAVIQVGTELWVAEGEIPTLLSGGDIQPRIPFLVERVHAP